MIDGSVPQESTFTIRGRHLSGLDGLRALAVMGVVAYHLRIGFARGGYLGVDLFFVISGFLITSLLLEEHHADSRVSLAAFWGRRARRLLPALFLMLVVVVTTVAMIQRHQIFFLDVDVQQLRGDAVSTVFYVANWYQIASSQSYFALFSVPSPLAHTWSLAIEEQFYLVFPFIVLVLLAVRRTARRGVAIGLLLVLAMCSAIEMAVLYHPGADPTRVYFGTDTRAFDLLIGAALAFASANRGIRSEKVGRTLEVVAWPAGLLLGLFWIKSGTIAEIPKGYMFRGGFLLCSVLAATVVATVALRPSSALAKALSLKPLVAIGIVSYGIYLWHWPVIDLYNPSSSGLSRLPLDLVRIAIIAALATLSYFLLERPIRRHRFSRGQAIVILPSAFAVTLAIALFMTSGFGEIPVPVTNVVTAPYTGSGPNHVIVGAGGFAGQVPIKIGRRITASDPLRVGFFGDSIPSWANGGVSAALESTGRVVTSTIAFPNWALSEPHLNATVELSNYRAIQHPDVLVGQWGWDNAAAAADPVGYQAQLKAFLEAQLHGKNAVRGVILLNTPPIAPVEPLFVAGLKQNLGTPANAAVWDQIVRNLVAQMPGKLMFLPASNAVLLPDGAFTTWLPPNNKPNAPYRDWVRVRRTDGVHLCQNGTVRYATALLTDFQQLFRIGPSVGPWWKGPWIHDPGYNIGLIYSLCPMDHPPKGSSPPSMAG